MKSWLSLTIEEVPSRARERALRFLLAEVWAFLPTHGLEPLVAGERLVWAHTDGQILGVTWAQVTEPGMVMIVPPRLAANIGGAVRRSLWCRIELGLAEDPRVRLAQVLLDEGDLVNAYSLQSSGFQSLTQIDFLIAEANRIEPTGRLQLERVGPEDYIRFQDVVSRSEAGNRDCVTLESWRREAGLTHQHGLDRANRDDCYFVQYDGRDVGALVLQRDGADAQHEGLLEIRYLGVYPDDRRRGFAAETLCRVRRFAAREGRTVVTAVDRDNAPACRAYSAAGFRSWRRRVLWGKRFAA